MNSNPEPASDETVKRATLRITTYGGGKTVQHWQLRYGDLFLADTSVQAHVEQWRQLVAAAPSVSTDRTDEKQSCPFCTRLRNGEYTTGADQGVMRFEPLNPVTPGHMLFMPKDHHADAAKLPHVTGFVFAEAARWASAQGESFNLITSAGADATQTVPHLHVHYVPRRAGDGLVLPWTDQKRREFDNAVEFYGGY